MSYYLAMGILGILIDVLFVTMVERTSSIFLSGRQRWR